MRLLYDSWKERTHRSGQSQDKPLVMPWLFSKPFRQQHPERIIDIETRFTGGYLARRSDAFERQVEANIAHNTRGALHRINVPVLILVGKHDALTPPRLARELQSEMPHAQVVVFEEGGHGLYWEVPHLFNQAVLGFLIDQT